MRYRRAFAPGGSFFFTVATAQRRPILASADAVAVLREALRRVRASRPFALDAAVIMPDHLHCNWTLPPGDSDFATRWRLVKTWFTGHCEATSRGAANAAGGGQGKQAIWQHRYWEHQLRNECDFRRHVEYIHFNPVKHGLVSAPVDWPYSTFHKFVSAGIYARDWGSAWIEIDGVGSE